MLTALGEGKFLKITESFEGLDGFLESPRKSKFPSRSPLILEDKQGVGIDVEIFARIGSWRLRRPLSFCDRSLW